MEEEIQNRYLLTYILCNLDKPIKSLDKLLAIIKKVKEKGLPVSYDVIEDSQGYLTCPKLDYDIKVLEQEGFLIKDVQLEDDVWENYVYNIGIAKVFDKESLKSFLEKNLGESLSSEAMRIINSSEIAAIIRESE
jgi:hypothetical protein